MRKLLFLTLMMLPLLSVAQVPGCYPYGQQPHCQHSCGQMPPPPPSVSASSEQVQAILEYVKGISMTDDRLKAAKLCAMLCSLQVKDLARIGELFAFDDARLEFYKSAYANCADQQHYMQLRKTMTFSSNADALMDFISR